MQFEVNVAPVGAWTVVAVAGEIDVATAPRLRKEAIAIVGEGHLRIVLDLEAVDFLDSTGLGVLIGVLRRINQVCTYALIAACAAKSKLIDQATFERVKTELDDDL